MSRGTVFKDRERLLPHFPIEMYWGTLPHRDGQIDALWRAYGDVLERRGEAFFRVVQAIGPAGTGKTCTLRLFGRRFQEEARKRKFDLVPIYINLKLEGGRKVVLYRNLLGKVDPNLVSASLSAEEMLRNLVRYLQETGKRLLLTVDEIDYYVRRFGEEGVVYDLTRLNELTPDRPCGVVGATFLAREKKFHELLDQAELSTLGRSFIEFQSYSSNQILEILERRASEALHPGTYSTDILEFIADVTASPLVNGDMRYALDLLLYSGNLADNEGTGRITPEHVRRVHGGMSHVITTEDIQSLPDVERLVLLGVARALKHRMMPYASLREIRSMVAVVCEELGVKPIDDVEDHVQDLHDRGIIDIKSLTKIGVSGVVVEDLDRFLNNLIERVRSGLDEA